MYVCFLSTFRLSNQTPNITPILTLYHANAAALMPHVSCNLHAAEDDI